MSAMDPQDAGRTGQSREKSKMILYVHLFFSKSYYDISKEP